METNDIQGNVVAGFNTRFEAFVTLAFRQDADHLKAAQWIGSLSTRLTTVDDVRGSREAMKDSSRGGLEPWLAVAISRRVIDAVHPSVILDDIDFNLGMVRRKTAIGDETLPTDWMVGGPSTPVDALLVIAANDPAPVEAMADDLVQQAAAAGLDLTYREMGMRLPNEVEHFGFKDGISQPEIAGDRSESGILPGHFVFGYPTVADGPPATNQGDSIGLTRNGSLLVFRRLAQDVGAFRAFFASESARLLAQWPGLTAELLAALVVGRWPSGAPVSIVTPADPGPGANDNAFDFHDDLDAARCPFGAHIRKVNPREGNRDVVDVPRILRRGIPFGRPFAAGAEAGRGLLFVSYQSSIKETFVFISASWMNTPDQPQPGGGFDLLAGRAPGPRSMPIEGPAGEVVMTFNQKHWITPTGGAYLFAPGRNGLAMLTRPSPSQRFLAAARTLAARAAARPAAGKEPDQRDGRLTLARAGRVQTLERAEWPLTRLTPDGAAVLHALRDLRHLDLAGVNFPTELLDAPGVRRLAATQPGLRHLAVHAAAVKGSVLRTAVSDLPLLSSLDLRGVDLADDDLAGILMAHPGLTTLLLGSTTEDRGPHHFHSGGLTPGVGQLLGQLPGLRALSLRGLPVDDASLLASSRMLAALEELDCGETNVGDRSARHLASQARVRRLWLDRTRVTDHGIVAFAETASLRDLDLSWTAVTAPAVDALLAKGTLSRLAVEGLSVSDASLPNLAAAGSMTDLDLARTGAGDQTVAAIVRLPLLERLSIAFSGVTSRGLATLAPSPLLELDARGLKVETETLTALSRMRRLRELQLTLHEDQWESLVAFEAGLSITAPPPRKEGMLPQGLKKLVLTGSLDPGFCRNLGRLQHLEALSVPGGAEHFGEIIGDAFPRLRSLFAESAGLDDVAVDMLGRLPNLEALFLSHNPIAASVVRLSAPLLHTLELRNTPVDDRAVEALARLPRLHCLDLPGTQVTADGIAALVPAARNLQSFALDGGQLTSTVARVLADSTTLVELYLYGPAVTDEVLARIAPLDRLRELNLFGTSLSDLSAPVLIALTGLRTLRIEGSLPSSSFVNGLRTARPDVQLSVAVDPVVARERSRRAFLTSEP